VEEDSVSPPASFPSSLFLCCRWSGFFFSPFESCDGAASFSERLMMEKIFFSFRSFESLPLTPLNLMESFRGWMVPVSGITPGFSRFFSFIVAEVLFFFGRRQSEVAHSPYRVCAYSSLLLLSRLLPPPLLKKREFSSSRLPSFPPPFFDDFRHVFFFLPSALSLVKTFFLSAAEHMMMLTFCDGMVTMPFSPRPPIKPFFSFFLGGGCFFLLPSCCAEEKAYLLRMKELF